MAIQIIGSGGVVADVDASPHRSLRVSLRPVDLGALGSYRLAISSGLTTGIAAATATAGHVFALRWGSSTSRAVLRYLSVEMVSISAQLAQEMGFDVVVARGYTASHSGQTAVTLTGSSMKKRASMPTTLVTDARIAGAAALTAGTHTLDPHPILQTQMAELVAAATVPKGRIIQTYDPGAVEYPLVLSQDEGIVVRNTIAQSTAVQRFNVIMAWDEFANASF